MGFLTIEGVSHRFPGVHGGAPTEALSRTDLSVEDNDFIAILGPSGTGYFTMYQYGAAPPSTSNINFNAGEPALANGALVALHPSDATLHFSAFAALSDVDRAALLAFLGSL